MDNRHFLESCYVLITSKNQVSMSISIGVEYVTLNNKIKCLKFNFFFWATPPIKLNWNCIYVGTTNRKAPRPFIMVDQSEILSRSWVQFITLFFGGAQLCYAFHQPQQVAWIWWRKTNFVSLTSTFWPFRNKFYCLESHTEHRWKCSKYGNFHVFFLRMWWTKKASKKESCDSPKKQKKCCIDAKFHRNKSGNKSSWLDTLEMLFLSLNGIV